MNALPRDIKADVLLASISGGTDIIACFMGENSTLPVYRGEIQSAHLGCGIQAWDESGHPVTGEPGELVCTAPFVSMPTRFWGKDGAEKYSAAYFSKFPNVWAHGDFILVSPKTQGITMLGRSDGGEERVLLFLQAVEGAGEPLDESLVSRLRSAIRSQLSVRHLPALVLPIKEIPYTVNGKKVEVAIKKILSGLEVKNKGALANPACLDLFANIPETKVW